MLMLSALALPGTGLGPRSSSGEALLAPLLLRIDGDDAGSVGAEDTSAVESEAEPGAPALCNALRPACCGLLYTLLPSWRVSLTGCWGASRLLAAEVLLRCAGVRPSTEAAAQRQPIAVPLAPVATGAPGAEEPESYVFSPSGIMLSRVRLVAPAAAAGDSGAAEDAHPEIQAAPAQQREHEAARAAADRHRRRGWRRRRAAAVEQEASAPEAPTLGSERNGLPSPNTDREREPRVRAGACVVGLHVVSSSVLSCPRVCQPAQSGDWPSAGLI